MELKIKSQVSLTDLKQIIETMPEGTIISIKLVTENNDAEEERK